MSQVFGGSKKVESSTSTNNAYPFLQQSLSGAVNNGANSSNQMADLLGLNGGPAQNQGFTNWKNSTGYNFGMDQGMQAVNGSAAAKGTLNSGSTLKALNTFGQGYADQQYGNYFGQLGSLLNSGIAGAGVLGDAGKTSSSYGKGTETKGSGGFIGSLLTK